MYEYGFDRYDISLRTGIEREELSRLGGEIRDYFNDDTELIDIDAVIYGELVPLFTEREIIHMKDVKGLVQGVYMFQWITLGYLLALIAAYAWLKRIVRLYRGIVRVGFWGGVVTLLIIGALGIGSVFGFESLFLAFHQLSFRQRLLEAESSHPQPDRHVPGALLPGRNSVRGADGYRAGAASGKRGARVAGEPSGGDGEGESGRLVGAATARWRAR